MNGAGMTAITERTLSTGTAIVSIVERAPRYSTANANSAIP